MRTHLTTAGRKGPRRLAAVLVALGLVLAGCSGDAEEPAADTDQPADAPADDTGDTGDDEDTSDDMEEDADDGEDAAADDGGAQGASTATITFASGETLSTDVVCTLEEQPSAGLGDVIPYTATSLSNPYFDVTVFADADGEIVSQSVTWDETEDFETYQESWFAGDIGIGASDLEVSLDGSTITASGTFVRGQDETGQEGETRQGEVTVECN